METENIEKVPSRGPFSGLNFRRGVIYEIESTSAASELRAHAGGRNSVCPVAIVDELIGIHAYV